jgi:hypothetical protein
MGNAKDLLKLVSGHTDQKVRKEGLTYTEWKSLADANMYSVHRVKGKSIASQDNLPKGEFDPSTSKGWIIDLTTSDNNIVGWCNDLASKDNLGMVSWKGFNVLMNQYFDPMYAARTGRPNLAKLEYRSTDGVIFFKKSELENICAKNGIKIEFRKFRQTPGSYELLYFVPKDEIMPLPSEYFSLSRDIR